MPWCADHGHFALYRRSRAPRRTRREHDPCRRPAHLRSTERRCSAHSIVSKVDCKERGGIQPVKKHLADAPELNLLFDIKRTYKVTNRGIRQNATLCNTFVWRRVCDVSPRRSKKKPWDRRDSILNSMFPVPDRTSTTRGRNRGGVSEHANSSCDVLYTCHGCRNDS